MGMRQRFASAGMGEENMNRLIIQGIFLILAGLTIMASGLMIIKQQKTINRQKNNIEVLNTGLSHYKGKDSLMVAKIGQISTKISDLKRYNNDLVEDVKDMNIALRKLKTAIKVSTVTEFHSTINVKDSVTYIRDTIPVVISTYKDNWINFYHRLQANKTDSLKISCRADLTHAIYWDRKGFWPLRFLKKKKYYLVTKSKNPYLRVDSLKYVNLFNKR